MAQEPTEDLLILDYAGTNLSMRTEAVARGLAADNWTMAALITSNGGASLALLSHADLGTAMIVAQALYMLGITAALIAGRLSAILAHEAEYLFGNLITLDQASRHLFRARLSGIQEAIDMGNENTEQVKKDVAKAREDYDKATAPGMSLALGILFFLSGCIAAGFALF